MVSHAAVARFAWCHRKHPRGRQHVDMSVGGETVPFEEHLNNPDPPDGGGGATTS